MRLLDGQRCEIDGVGFVGVKGFAGGFGRRMLGSFGEPAIKRSSARRERGAAARERHAQRASRSAPSSSCTTRRSSRPSRASRWRSIPFLGSSRLAETIDRFKVSAIVHGHAHRGTLRGPHAGRAAGLQRRPQIEKPSGKPYAILEI